MASELPTGGDSTLTRGSDEGNFVEVDTAQKPPANFSTGGQQDVPAKTSGSNWGDLLANSGHFLKSVEEHFATFAILISLVGYVLIAAFGGAGMSLSGFILYVVFLGLLYIAHSTLSEPALIKQGFASLNRFFIFGFFVLLAIVLFQNQEVISQSYNAAKKYFAPVQQGPIPSAGSESSASSHSS
jgi:hypothetical protein